MTVKQIEKCQAAELAKQIRQLLDDASKQHGAHWGEDFEETVIELVTED